MKSFITILFLAAAAALLSGCEPMISADNSIKYQESKGSNTTVNASAGGSINIGIK